MEKGFVLRYDRPEHSRYYYCPNLNKIADALGVPENSRSVITDKKSQFIENIRVDLAGLAERKAQREELARQQETAKEERMARQRAQYRASAAQSQKFTAEVERQIAEPAAPAVATDIEAPVEAPVEPAAKTTEYAWCNVGGIVARLDEDGNVAIRIVEQGF